MRGLLRIGDGGLRLTHPRLQAFAFRDGRFVAYALRDEWPQAEAAAKRLMASDDPRQRWEGGATLAIARKVEKAGGAVTLYQVKDGAWQTLETVQSGK